MKRSIMLYLLLLLFLCGGSVAHAADPPRPDDPRRLASGLSEPFLLGLDDRYVYWVDRPVGADGSADRTVQRLRRVSKQGGAVEPLIELQGEADTDCGSAVVGGNALFVFRSRENPFDATAQIVAVDTTNPRTMTPIGKARLALCNLVVQSDRLYWTDEENDGELWSARLDGSGARRLWKASRRTRVIRVAARRQDLVLFLWTAGPAGPAQGIGLAHLGELQAHPTHIADVIAISSSGKAKRIWHGDQLLSDGAVDGLDVFICSEQGLLRIPGGQAGPPVRLTRACEGDLRLWRGWRLEAETNLAEGAMLVARKLTSPEDSVAALSHVYGGSKNVLLESDAGYACTVIKAPETCDLVRLPGPAWLDRLATELKPPSQ